MSKRRPARKRGGVNGGSYIGGEGMSRSQGKKWLDTGRIEEKKKEDWGGFNRVKNGSILGSMSSQEGGGREKKTHPPPNPPQHKGGGVGCVFGGGWLFFVLGWVGGGGFGWFFFFCLMVFLFLFFGVGV